jgi:hypothetical protein
MPINGDIAEVQGGAHHVFVEWLAILVITGGQDNNMVVV